MNYNKLVGPNITVLGERSHAKASERYIDVVFEYREIGDTWEGAVPIEYRRTGLLAEAPEEIAATIQAAYEVMDPHRRATWVQEQDKFWASCNKRVTQPFFDSLKETFKWTCVSCGLPPNPNWARRSQDIKELGYTIATDTKRFCDNCGKNTTHLVLLALPRAEETGYEVFNKHLRERILRVLGHFDVYENRVARGYSLLPDHKFPEIRWDESTRQENPTDMSDKEIRAKFQLLSNQRNQQKREVCRQCFQTGQRGTPFGIVYFCEGNSLWPSGIPERGSRAEAGCRGCGWYDMVRWRESLNKHLVDK